LGIGDRSISNIHFGSIIKAFEMTMCENPGELYSPEIKTATVFLPALFTINSQPNPILRA